ncbi:urease accessory protein UreF [Nonomuraea sp. NPDC050556]|uniref:urease accessory protein UreF n=1 Tax=Nonomuraea sp. NPDC050556 TaxID=3364369 RepID=UPI0037914A7F
MNPALLLLTDSRLPAGGHAHSGGVERAIVSGGIDSLETLARFLTGRLHTSGLVAASFAAAACSASAPCGRPSPGAAPSCDAWTSLDAELDARTPSPAQREASRTQGRLLLRVARRLWPSPVLDTMPQSPHHPIVLGAVAHAAGLSPEDAALAAAYHSVTGPATAAVRLLGLDPVEVHRLLATLAPDLDQVTRTAQEGLSAASAPLLDLLAEQHTKAEIRLFIS